MKSVIKKGRYSLSILLGIWGIFSLSSCSTETSISSDSGMGIIRNSTSIGGTTGVGGSFARFTIVGDYLYVLHRNTLFTYLISDPANPQFLGPVQIGSGNETIHHNGNHLFLGADQGMRVYSIQDPTRPRFVGEYTHATACDPVIVINNYAYVTLHSGTECRGNINQMDVLDVSNVSQPRLLNTLPMKQPKGLGGNSEYLYVCDKDEVVIFSLLDPILPEKVGAIAIENPYDIIVLNDLLMVTSQEGIHQYTLENPASPLHLSHIRAHR